MSVVHAEPHTVELDAARQFDFWLGEWDCTWVHDGDRCTATNSVYADLGGCVLVENFDGRLAGPAGPQLRSTTGPLMLEADLGRQPRGLPRLRRRLRERCHGAAAKRRSRRHPAIFRMRWENIESELLRLARQRSVDGGETWTSLWELEYRRVL